MNEAIETAREAIVATLTAPATVKQLRDIVRKTASGWQTLVLHGTATPGRESYSGSYIWSLSANGNPELTLPGSVGNGQISVCEEAKSETDGYRWMRYTEAYKPLRGSWSLTYCNQKLLDILDLLPKDAEVSFSVYLDHGTNGYLTQADCPLSRGNGLHQDYLYLNVSYMRRGKKVKRQYLIDVNTTPHNSARFGNPNY